MSPDPKKERRRRYGYALVDRLVDGPPGSPPDLEWRHDLSVIGELMRFSEPWIAELTGAQLIKPKDHQERSARREEIIAKGRSFLRRLTPERAEQDPRTAEIVREVLCELLLYWCGAVPILAPLQRALHHAKLGHQVLLTTRSKTGASRPPGAALKIARVQARILAAVEYRAARDPSFGSKKRAWTSVAAAIGRQAWRGQRDPSSGIEKWREVVAKRLQPGELNATLKAARALARAIELLQSPVPQSFKGTIDDNTFEEQEEARCLLLWGEERYGDAALKLLGDELRALQSNRKPAGSPR